MAWHLSDAVKMPMDTIMRLVKQFHIGAQEI